MAGTRHHGADGDVALPGGAARSHHCAIAHSPQPWGSVAAPPHRSLPQTNMIPGSPGSDELDSGFNRLRKRKLSFRRRTEKGEESGGGGGWGPRGVRDPSVCPPSDAEAAGEPRGGQKALRLSRGCQAPGAPRGPAEWEPCHCSSPSSSPSSDEDEHPAPAPGAAALSPFRSPRPGGEAPTATDTEEREGSDTCNPLSGGDGTWGASHFSASCSAWAKHLPKPHLLPCTLISPTRSCIPCLSRSTVPHALPFLLLHPSS